MGGWYTIGILVGLGTAIGVATVGALARVLPALVVAGAIAAVVGFLVFGWQRGGRRCRRCSVRHVRGGPIVTGALRRGGTRGGTATLLGLVSLVGAALAFVPVLGYLEALAVPLLGARACAAGHPTATQGCARSRATESPSSSSSSTA